jgi:hypothetical protein
MSEAAIPEGFYYFIGFLIITNIGALGTALVMLVKASIWFGATREKLDRNIQDTNAAHIKLRELEKLKGR